MLSRRNELLKTEITLFRLQKAHTFRVQEYQATAGKHLAARDDGRHDYNKNF